MYYPLLQLIEDRSSADATFAYGYESEDCTPRYILVVDFGRRHVEIIAGSRKYAFDDCPFLFESTALQSKLNYRGTYVHLVFSMPI